MTTTPAHWAANATDLIIRRPELADIGCAGHVLAAITDTASIVGDWVEGGAA